MPSCIAVGNSEAYTHEPRTTTDITDAIDYNDDEYGWYTVNKWEQYTSSTFAIIVPIAKLVDIGLKGSFKLEARLGEPKDEHIADFTLRTRMLYNELLYAFGESAKQFSELNNMAHRAGATILPIMKGLRTQNGTNVSTVSLHSMVNATVVASAVYETNYKKLASNFDEVYQHENNLELEIAITKSEAEQNNDTTTIRKTHTALSVIAELRKKLIYLKTGLNELLLNFVFQPDLFLKFAEIEINEIKHDGEATKMLKHIVSCAALKLSKYALIAQSVASSNAKLIKEIIVPTMSRLPGIREENRKDSSLAKYLVDIARQEEYMRHVVSCEKRKLMKKILENRKEIEKYLDKKIRCTKYP